MCTHVCMHVYVCVWMCVSACACVGGGRYHRAHVKVWGQLTWFVSLFYVGLGDWILFVWFDDKWLTHWPSSLSLIKLHIKWHTHAHHYRHVLRQDLTRLWSLASFFFPAVVAFLFLGWVILIDKDNLSIRTRLLGWLVMALGPEHRQLLLHWQIVSINMLTSILRPCITVRNS